MTSSWSSTATIPLNVAVQITKLNVPPAIANLAASFGATIGQNGCAGIYLAMLAMMVAPTMGLPVTIVTLLISIEPLIDMARTALNVSGAITAGTITSRLLK